MKKHETILDERQETELLKIERNGCWIAFWGLLLSLIVQSLMGSPSFSRIGAEWILFMVLALYLTGACMKKGIWSRNYRPDRKTNLLFSGAAAAACMVFVFAAACTRRPDAMRTCILLSAVSGAVLFIILLVSLSLAASAVRKRQEELDREPEDAGENK